MKKTKLSRLWCTLLFMFVGFIQMHATQMYATRVDVVNYSEQPVYATAVIIPAKQVGASASRPLKATDQHGRDVPLQLVGDTLYAYLSLNPLERLDLELSETNSWRKTLASASFSNGSGHIDNGIVRLDFANDQWMFSFDGPMSEKLFGKDLQLVKNCKIDLWLDTKKDRGRLVGYSEEKLRKMGLIHTSDARLVGGEASVKPDGSATLKLVRTFDGFAKSVTWTQTYTLLPGLPQVLMNIDFTVDDGSTLYFPFITHGGGLAGQYGSLLKTKPLLKFGSPKSSEAQIVGGASSILLRVAWRNERCWLGFLSNNGAGLGISTLEETQQLDRGSTAWCVYNDNFLVTLLENERKHFPFDLSRGKPMHNGFTLLATSGNVDVWQQTRDLFQAQTKNKPLQLATSYGVFLDGKPLQTGYVNTYFSAKELLVPTSDGKTLQAAVKLSHHKEYVFKAQTKKNATISVQAFPSGKELDRLELTGGVAQHTLLSAPHNEKEYVDLVLSVPAVTGVMQFSVEKAPLAAPRLSTPRMNQNVTDFAVFFRWEKVPGVFDYELQWAADAGFSQPKKRRVQMETALPFYMPEDKELPDPGVWYWRVRAIDGDSKGAWSETRCMRVTDDHSRSPLQFEISTENPLFTYEAFSIPRENVEKFRDTHAAGLQKYMAFTMVSNDKPKVLQQANLVEFFEPLAESDMRFFTRPMHPGSMAEVFGSLSEVEALFQTYPNCLGTHCGESMTSLYRGKDKIAFSRRLLRLCAKYGRLFYMADGTYPEDNKWEEMYGACGDFLKDYRQWIAFAQKNNIHCRQMLTQSSTLGLYLSGLSVANGAWEDGGWYWQQVGFRKLGEFHGVRGGEVQKMPRIFWTLNFVMGISRGTTSFNLDGQTGTKKHKDGAYTAYRNSPGFWTNQGEFLPTYTDFVQPLFKAIIEHQLIPTKEQVMDNVKLVVYNDGVSENKRDEPPYYQYHPLYSGTYGFKPIGSHPGESYEFFPNTGRYHYFPVLPQGKTDLGHGIKTLPLSELMDECSVRDTFNSNYPEWYKGDALVGLVGNTLTVLNSNENQDEQQEYSLPLKGRGQFKAIQGTIDVHSYLVGKFEKNDSNLWVQTNSEYPKRTMRLAITCDAEPNVEVAPAKAMISKSWKKGVLTMRLSYAHGVVELNIN